jgi:flavin reductase (DIM6/NTAB) family NADH-FMN oxidoreductase RutF
MWCRVGHVSDIERALGLVPAGGYILTAGYDGARSGVLVGWVQRCASNPPMVMLALPTGLPVIPLIRDSRSFALCQIAADDRFLSRKFAAAPEHGEDPFVTLATATARSGSPLVLRAMSYLDCELVRHIDLEADCGLYVGLVRDGGMLAGGRPAVTVHECGNGECADDDPSAPPQSAPSCDANVRDPA